MSAQMRFTLTFNLTFKSIRPNCWVSYDSLHHPLLTNKVISHKYCNRKCWINESPSKCFGLSGSLSLNSPFHQAVHTSTPWEPRQRQQVIDVLMHFLEVSPLTIAIPGVLLNIANNDTLLVSTTLDDVIKLHRHIYHYLCITIRFRYNLSIPQPRIFVSEIRSWTISEYW